MANEAAVSRKAAKEVLGRIREKHRIPARG